MISLKIKLVTCKIMLLFVLILIASHRSYAQSVPSRFAYQAVIRDSKGALIVDDEVGIKIEIAKESGNGNVIFSEDHKVLTNKQGLVSLEIGSKADLSTLNWAQGPYFIVLSVDTEGGTDYTEVGSFQLLSVPYALYAANGGVPGPKGDPGISIKSGALNANGNLILTLTDNTTKDVGNVKGSPGSQGAAGRGVASFIINSSGELVVTYSDNTISNLGKVKGENGNAGNYLGSATIDISNNTVSVKDNSISSANIADGEIGNIDIAGDAVTSAKIANRTIQGVDIAQMNATANQVLSWSGVDWIPTTPSGGSGGNPTGAAGGDLTGTYPNPTIGVGKISESKIADNAVTNAKIQDGTIVAADLNAMGATNGQVLTFENGWKPKAVGVGNELWKEINGYLEPKNTNAVSITGTGSRIDVNSDILINGTGWSNTLVTGEPYISIQSIEKKSAVTLSTTTDYQRGLLSLNNKSGAMRVLSQVEINPGSGGGTFGTLNSYNHLGKMLFRTSMNVSGYGWAGVFDGLDSKAFMYVTSNGIGYLSAGGSSGGVKSFVMPHPSKQDSTIWYACIEGPEAASYERGTATLVEGEAFIPFSDHFAIVVNPKTMTVTTSPNSADSKGLAVIEKTAKGIRVKELYGGKGNYTLDWEVKGVRKGHEDFKVIRHKSEGQSADAGKSSTGDSPVLPKKPE